jgi:hypothetical protein
MRIAEILFWNNEPTEGNRSDPQLDVPPARFHNDLTNLANAFTRSGLVKHFWNVNGSKAQPSGPASPDAGTELSGTLEPSNPDPHKGQSTKNAKLPARNLTIEPA